jgi:hypothetical protein
MRQVPTHVAATGGVGQGCTGIVNGRFHQVRRFQAVLGNLQ